MSTAKTGRRIAFMTLSPLALLLAGGPCTAVAAPALGEAPTSLSNQLTINAALSALPLIAETGNVTPEEVICQLGYSHDCKWWIFGCHTTCTGGYSDAKPLRPPVTAVADNVSVIHSPSPFDAFDPWA